MSMKIILDTDIGSDIDDAVCLAYLLAQPECELLGITTVSGEPVQRAMIASALCTLAARARVPARPGDRVPAPDHPRPPRRSHAAGDRPHDQCGAAVRGRPRDP